MLELDRKLFEWINSEWTNAYLDMIFPVLRDGANWIPLYIFLFGFAVYKFRQRIVYWVIALLLMVAVTDGVGNYGFKKNVERPRPCHAESNVDVRLLVKCGSGYSFTSNHAANHMGLAIFFAITLFSGSWSAMALFLFWGFAIGYAQIYVGVHYPLDILGGYLLGIVGSVLGITVHLKLMLKDPFFKSKP